MKYKLLVIVCIISVTLIMSGCSQVEKTEMIDYNTSSNVIGIKVASNSNFVEDESILFSWQLLNTSEAIIDYEGTPFVVLNLYDQEGNFMDGNPNGYDDYVLGGSFSKGILNEGTKVFENLEQGEYTLEIIVSWMKVNNHDIDSIRDELTLHICK